VNLTRLRTAADRFHGADRRRDEAYRALADALADARDRGATLGQLADATGLSRQRIDQLLRRR
jgi:hypothetical protein